MSSTCGSCGAPDDGVSVICRFCKQPVVAEEILASALRCPSCATPNRGERTQCGACGGSLLVRCIFCDHGSSMREAACVSCGEPFAGAQERKSAQQADKVIDTVGDLFGALTGNRSSSSSRSSSRAREDDEPPRRRGGGDGRNSGGGIGGGNAPPMDS